MNSFHKFLLVSALCRHCLVRCHFSVPPCSFAALPADGQEDEFCDFKQPGAGRRPETQTVVPPEGAAAAGAHRGGAASGLQAGGDNQGSPCRLPRSPCRICYSGAQNHAFERSGDPPPSHGVPVNVHIRCLTVNVQSTANLLFFFFLTGEFRRAEAGGRRHF